jgi:hypothetical protein
VHDQIRVAPDRRGEVQVRRRGQPEVPRCSATSYTACRIDRSSSTVQHLLLRVLLRASSGRRASFLGSSASSDLERHAEDRAHRSRASIELRLVGLPRAFRKIAGALLLHEPRERTCSFASSISSSMSWYAFATPGSRVRRCTSSGAPVAGSKVTMRASGTIQVERAPAQPPRAQQHREIRAAPRSSARIASASSLRSPSAVSRKRARHAAVGQLRGAGAHHALDEPSSARHRPRRVELAPRRKGTSRITLGSSEHRFDESARGSIGIARSGR